jgi:ABC-2 type transport system ATP-binding protein
MSGAAAPIAEATQQELPPRAHRGDASWHSVVAFEGVWRHWGRGQKRRAVLRDLNLELRRGTVTNISGRNGAGKTTLLRIATGILAPDQGRVTIGGMESRGNWRDYHRLIGFLSAGDRGLYPRLAVEAHLSYWAKLAFLPRKDCRAATEEAIQQFGLSDLRDRRADRLSLGQRQRLRLALAFVHRPEVLLLDEPRSSLDGEGLGLLSAAVSNVASRGGAVLWCSPTSEDQPVQFDQRLVLEDAGLRRV